MSTVQRLQEQALQCWEIKLVRVRGRRQDDEGVATDEEDSGGLRHGPPVGWSLGVRPGDAVEGKGPQMRPQQRLGRRLEEVAQAVGGGYCRLQMPLKLARRQGDSGWP